ncbi:ATP-binding protein [uncultured Shewanella sp.]|uniref:ATP-binding protein n=1 Tax=uncultured Shewanella sp. TaxID=173975 RepID=UPI00262AA3EC|nr:ATP-binding protein [uncultured Shewanella sp.]
MTSSESILLPSQEALLLRLQHISLYGEQLILLLGDQGSGKTTMITALLDTLDDHSLALITCPKHSDSHEIRRKILMQLLEEPIFDDELALSDSLQQAVESLPEALCIVIDDADYLPHEIWEECLALTQLSLPHTVIRVVCTLDDAFFSSLSTQVSAVQAECLLPINIPPLSLVERQSLFDTLLSLNEQGAVVDADIIFEKLSAQSGTPEEVLALFEFSMHNVAAFKMHHLSVNRKVMPTWMSLILVTLVLLIVLVTGAGLWMLKLPIDGQVNTALLVEKTPYSSANTTAIPVGLNNLQDRELELKKESQSDDVAAVSSQTKEASAASEINIVEREHGKVGLSHQTGVEAFSVNSPSQFVRQTDKDKPLASESIQNGSSSDVVRISTIHSGLDSDKKQDEILHKRDNDKVASKVKKEAVRLTSVQPLIVWPTLLSVRPTHGYTLQLANVTKIETLYRLLTKVKEVEGLSVARYKKGWLVLVGQFDKKEFANKKSTYLIEKYKISKPWVRRWADLSEYELQVSVPSREIQ